MSSYAPGSYLLVFFLLVVLILQEFLYPDHLGSISTWSSNFFNPAMADFTIGEG